MKYIFVVNLVRDIDVNIVTINLIKVKKINLHKPHIVAFYERREYLRISSRQWSKIPINKYHALMFQISDFMCVQLNYVSMPSLYAWKRWWSESSIDLVRHTQRGDVFYCFTSFICWIGYTTCLVYVYTNIWKVKYF